MPHRDPQTGQFLPHDDDGFEDIEVATFGATVGIQAADLNGTTTFSGQDEQLEALTLIDYDQLVDRNESLQLLYASHALTAYPNSTETADGTFAVIGEVSASPDFSNAIQEINTNSIEDSANMVGSAGLDDTIDVIGRPLTAGSTGAFSDGASGVGGGGSSGQDRWDSSVFPGQYGAFHPRDEVFLNMDVQVWNIDDAGVHVQVEGQHVYGVVEEPR